MKKIIALLAVLVLLFAFFGGCAVNSTTGAITVTNSSTKAISDLKIGTVNVGYIGSGSTSTVYFTSDQSSAQITATGFSPSQSSQSGKINLKVNYYYSFSFYQTSAGYYYNGSGSKLGDANTYEAIQ